MPDDMVARIPVGEPWWWRYGFPAPIWIRDIGLIHETIKEFKLSPLEELGRVAPTTQAKGAKVPIGPRIPSFPGGMRIPHLHLGEQIYPLSPEQWQSFSRKVVARLKDRLAGAKEISFTQLMEISDAIDAL